MVDVRDYVSEFLSKVPIREEGKCWEWKGSTFTTGYGRFHYGGKTAGAHRASYAIHVGIVGPKMVIHHTCHNRSCVNPDHLREVTRTANIIESLAYKSDHGDCGTYERRREGARSRRRKAYRDFRNPKLHWRG